MPRTTFIGQRTRPDGYNGGEMGEVKSIDDEWYMARWWPTGAVWADTCETRSIEQARAFATTGVLIPGPTIYVKRGTDKPRR